MSRVCMQEWSYFRGGLSTIDRDYGIFNKIHHDIGTHVVHHLFPQMPHYNLTEATEVPPPLGKSPLHGSYLVYPGNCYKETGYLHMCLRWEPQMHCSGVWC